MSDRVDFDTLRERSRARYNFMPIVYGQAISLFGDYVAIITLQLFVLDLTGSATDLGLTAAAETAPVLLFGLLAGVLLDRTVLRRTLIFADAARALAFSLLALGIALDVARLWMVFGVAFVIGSMSVIFDSGLQALLPLTLTDNMLVTANSRLQLARTLAMVAGPATGGVLAASPGGFQLAFLLNATTFIASAIFLTMIRELRVRKPEPRIPVIQAIQAGLRFLWSEARLRWGTIGATVVNLVFAPLEATLVLFAQERLGLGLGGTGLLFSVHAGIAVAGLAVAPAVAKRLPLGRMYVIGVILFGSGFVVVAFSTQFWMAGLFGGIGLLGVGWLNVALFTLRQRLAPTEMLGRVITASRTLAWIGIPIGAAGGATLADVIGVAALYQIGAWSVTALGVLMLLTPLWHKPVPEPVEAPVSGPDVSPRTEDQ